MKRTNCVPVPEQNMVRVNLPDGLLHTLVPRQHSDVFLVGWFVEWIVPCDPRISLVSLGQFLPQYDCSILEFEVFPEKRAVDTSIGVPVNVLAPRSCVKVENCVDPVRCALRIMSPYIQVDEGEQRQTYKIDNSVEPLKSTFVVDTRIHVVLEVSVIEWNSGDINQ